MERGYVMPPIPRMATHPFHKYEAVKMCQKKCPLRRIAILVWYLPPFTGDLRIHTALWWAKDHKNRKVHRSVHNVALFVTHSIAHNLSFVPCITFYISKEGERKIAKWDLIITCWLSLKSPPIEALLSFFRQLNSNFRHNLCWSSFSQPTFIYSRGPKCRKSDHLGFVTCLWSCGYCSLVSAMSTNCVIINLRFLSLWSQSLLLPRSLINMKPSTARFGNSTPSWWKFSKTQTKVR